MSDLTSLSCRDCGEAMTLDDIADYRARGMEPQAKPGDSGGHEGICNSCLEERRESPDDLIAEFCG